MIHSRLHFFIDNYHISITKLADYVGCSRMAIYNYYNCLQDPGLEHAYKIANYIDEKYEPCDITDIWWLTND